VHFLAHVNMEIRLAFERIFPDPGMPRIARFQIPYRLRAIRLDISAAIVVVVVVGVTVVAGHRFAHGVESLQAMRETGAHVAATRPEPEQLEIKSGARR
jgi:hypothetical protein